MRDGAPAEGEVEARRAVAEASGMQSTRIATDLKMMIGSARHYGMDDLADELASALQLA
jgi:hypothetical protein